MIISHKYKFAFIHIPKCAGGYIRYTLFDLDDLNDFFRVWRPLNNPESDRVEQGRLAIEKSPDMPYPDFAHLPLDILAARFPEHYDAVKRYESFAVARDPYERFESAMAQRYKTYNQMKITEAGSSHLKNEITKVIEFVTKNPDSLHPGYIYFKPQSKYIYLNEDRVVKHVYPIEQSEAVLRHIEGLVGEDLAERSQRVTDQQKHLDMVYKNSAVRWFANATRPVRSNALVKSVQDRIMPAVKKHLFAPRSDVSIDALKSEYVRDFVESYYADDFALYENAKA